MTTKHVDLVLTPKTIIPVIPRGTVESDTAIIIDKQKIIDLTSSSTWKENYTARQHIDLPEHAVLPGFINMHGHAAMTLFRGMADDLPLMEWLNNHIWPAEGKWVSEEFVKDGTNLAIAEMIKCGTTYYSDMYFFPEVSAMIAKSAGIKSQHCAPILDFPTAWGSGPDEYLSKTEQLAKTYDGDPLVQIAIGPHAPYTVSDTPFKSVISLSKKYNLNVQIHLHETQSEVDEALAQNGARPLQRLKDLGLFELKEKLQCVHMTALDNEDIATLRASNSSVVHCPESNLKLSSGFCPLGILIDQNINITIGTDGAASNNDLDILGELRTAALLAKATSNNATTLGAAEALEAITINAARALGKENETGSIEVGKFADLIAINLDELNTTPCYNLVSNIVYSASSSQITHSWVNGRALMIDRELKTVNEALIKKTANIWADKISENKA